MANPSYSNYNGTALVPTAPNLPLAPNVYDQVAQNQLLNVLRLYFNQLNNFSFAIATPDQGTKTNRPKTTLQIGQIYFDTTLGIPIWWNGKNWINASGTTV